MAKAVATLSTGLVIALLLSCGKEKGSPALPPPTPLPDVVSFNTHVLPLFNNYCNTSGCHSGGVPAAGLDLSPAVAYNQLFAKHEVDTITPGYSVLYIEMNSTSNPMPVSGRLSDYDVGLVLKWIRQKAKNN